MSTALPGSLRERWRPGMKLSAAQCWWGLFACLLLFGPVVLGLATGALWYIPNAASRLPVLVALAVYYTAVFALLKAVTGAGLWKN